VRLFPGGRRICAEFVGPFRSELEQPLQRLAGMAWKKLMCPVDHSPGSREALSTATAMAVEADAELVIVHVWTPPVFSMGEGVAFGAEMIGQMIKEAESSLAQRKAEAEKLGARRVTTQFYTGAAWHEIVGAAKKDPTIDLIVIGTHGRTGLKHVFIGSVAEKVVRHAPCPVLVVRARD
jgi:universal stress protein A